MRAHTYSHTGYTGTSIVIDPDNDISVILLINAVHPDDKGSTVRLRALVSNADAMQISLSALNKNLARGLEAIRKRFKKP